MQMVSGALGSFRVEGLGFRDLKLGAPAWIRLSQAATSANSWHAPHCGLSYLGFRV